MRRKRLLISVGLVLGFLALVLVGLAAAVKREPSFYTQADLPAGPERTVLSQQALARYSEILGLLDDSSWTVEFSTEQVNAFFQEDYYKFGGDDNWPEGVSAPRVKIEDGKMRFGFRYGAGVTSTVVSLEIRLWKVANELNTIAMEIVSFRAGSLPLSTGNLLDLISRHLLVPPGRAPGGGDAVPGRPQPADLPDRPDRLEGREGDDQRPVHGTGRPPAAAGGGQAVVSRGGSRRPTRRPSGGSSGCRRSGRRPGGRPGDPPRRRPR
jgi:hypothetical protein